MSTPTNPNPATAAPPDDIFAASSLACAEAPSARSLGKSLAALIGAQYGAPICIVSLSEHDQPVLSAWDRGGAHVSRWRSILDADVLDAQWRHCAVARVYGDGTEQPSHATIAVPIIRNGDTVGAIGVVAGCTSRADAERISFELQSLAASIGAQIGSTSASAPHHTDSDAHETIGSVLAGADRCKDVHELAFMVTNSLRNRLACEHVALGLVRAQSVRLASISGMDELKHRTPGSKAIVQAMEECLDAAHPVRSATPVPEDEGAALPDTGAAFALHTKWSTIANGAQVASVPIRATDDGPIVGVLSLRRPPGERFSDDDLRHAQELVMPVAPALRLVERASRSPVRVLTDSVRDRAAWFMKPGELGSKILMVAGVLMLAWFLFGSAPYRVTVKSVVSAEERRNIAAPFEARIAEVLVEPGTRVLAGDPLVRFDVSDLLLERERLRAEIGVLDVEVASAIGAEEVGDAKLAGARRRVAVTTLGMVQHRIERATISAPTDGLVLDGDLRRRVGEVVPLGEPLLVLGHGTGLRAELLIPERDVTEIGPGSTVRFASNARPDEPVTCSVHRVAPSAEIRENRNVFVAEATLDDARPWMRDGMEGVARIDAGDKPIWWITLNRAIDFVALNFWPQS